MTKRFAKKYLAAALTTAALTFAVVTPARAAGQSDDWFEQQRSLTEGAGFDYRPGAAPAPPDKGARSRVGDPAASRQRQTASKQEYWLLEQRLPAGDAGLGDGQEQARRLLAGPHHTEANPTLAAEPRVTKAAAADAHDHAKGLLQPHFVAQAGASPFEGAAGRTAAPELDGHEQARRLLQR